MELWIFETETLLAMRADARRVAEAAVNGPSVQEAARKVVVAIGTELRQRGRD